MIISTILAVSNNAIGGEGRRLEIQELCRGPLKLPSIYSLQMP